MTDVLTLIQQADKRARQDLWRDRYKKTRNVLALCAFSTLVASEGVEHYVDNRSVPLPDYNDVVGNMMASIDNSMKCAINEDGKPVLIARGPFNVAAHSINFVDLDEPDEQGQLGYCSFTDDDGFRGYAIAVPQGQALDTI